MSDRICSYCRKAEEPNFLLKMCGKCRITLYCSRDCQKADWKDHKKVCGKTDPPQASSQFPPFSSSARLSPPKGLDQPIAKPFTRLNNGTWLHDRPELDVYRLLIDAYRLRVEDDYTFNGEVDDDCLYANPGASSTFLLRGFRRFLRKTASRPGLLPPWWSADKQAECEALSIRPNQWHNLHSAVEKNDIMEHYDDPTFPMQLRMFAEEVLLRGIGPHQGAEMRAVMMAIEEQDAVVTPLKLSSMNKCPYLRQKDP